MTVKKISFLLAVAASLAFAPAAPAPAASLEELRSSFAYDKTAPTNVEIVETLDQGNSIKYKLFYDSPTGERVPALFTLPKKRPPEGVPAVFFMHFHVSDKSLSDVFSSTWAGYGLATFAIDGVFRGERADLKGDILDPNPDVAIRNLRTQITDILRGLDVLAGWEGINPDQIGYFGISAGALSGVPVVAMDGRIKAAALIDGGGGFDIIFQQAEYDDWDKLREFMKAHAIDLAKVMESFKAVDPVAFAPHVKARVLMINGDADKIVPVDAIKALFAALGGPKKIDWFEGGHYDVPLEKSLIDIRKMFSKALKERDVAAN